MKSITLNLDKSVPYHLTTYTKVNEVDDNFIQFIVFAFVLAVILLVTVLLLSLPK